jgi:hypothetical protein
MGGIGEIFGLGSTVASAVGGGKGGGSPQSVNIPPFESQGGITPEQQSYAQYEYDQGMVKNESQFADTGTGMSTMDTQGGTGVRMGEAKTQAAESGANQDAAYKAYQNQISGLTQGLQNQSTLQSQNLSNLDTLAKLSNTQSNTTDSTSGEAAAVTGG